MREEIIKLINEKGPLSYGELLNILKCDNSELAQVIYTMEVEAGTYQYKYIVNGNFNI